MIASQPENEADFFLTVLNGDRDATAFCLDLFYVVHLWDDLIDKDKPRGDDEINKAFEISLVHMPNNRFFQTYREAITPMIHTAIHAWYESNRLERGNEDQKFYSFFLRNLLLNVLYFACLVTNGSFSLLHDHLSLSMKSKYEEFLREEINHA